MRKQILVVAAVMAGVSFFWGNLSALRAEADQGANVIIMKKADILAYDATTIVELINMLPGINTTDSGTLSMGGFSASDIIVTLDGRPINDQTITAKYINWGEVDYSTISRIEIHKISSRCSGGEIKIFTQQKGDSFGGRLKAWQGIRDHQGIDGSINQGKGDYFFSAAHSWSTEGEHHHNNNDEEHTATSLKMAMKKKFALSGSFAFSRDEGGSAIFSYDTPEKTRPADCDDYYPDPTKARYQKKRESYGGVINFENGDFFSELFMNDHLKENHATGVKKDENGNVIYETDEQGNVSTIPFLGGNEADVLEYGAKVGISKKAYEYGLRSIFTTADFSKTSTQGVTTTGDADEYLLDLYASTHWKGFAVSANLFYHDDYGLDAFPKLAYSYPFNPYYIDISLTATKKYPSFFQKHFSTSSTRANPDLDPQTNICLTFKIGGDHQIGNSRIGWQLAPFFNKAYDRFYSQTYFQLDENGNPIIDPETGKNKVDYQEYDNLDESYWTGGDAILTYDYDGWVGMDLRFTYEYTRDEVHNSSFSYISPYKFKGRLYLKPLKNINLQLWSTYYSNRYADQEETYKMLWYYYLDFKATYKALEKVDLFFEVQNLTDFDYYVYRGYPGNCRRWWVGLEIGF